MASVAKYDRRTVREREGGDYNTYLCRLCWPRSVIPNGYYYFYTDCGCFLAKWLSKAADTEVAEEDSPCLLLAWWCLPSSSWFVRTWLELWFKTKSSLNELQLCVPPLGFWCFSENLGVSESRISFCKSIWFDVIAAVFGEKSFLVDFNAASSSSSSVLLAWLAT